MVYSNPFREMSHRREIASCIRRPYSRKIFSLFDLAKVRFSYIIATLQCWCFVDWDFLAMMYAASQMYYWLGGMDVILCSCHSETYDDSFMLSHVPFRHLCRCLSAPQRD